MEHKLAVYLEKRFSNCTERTELEKVKMIYGLEILMDNMFKLLAIIVLGMVLGIFKETMCAFCGFGILRIKAGGFHCETNKMCWLVSIFCSVGNAYIADQVVLPLSVGIALSAMCILLIGRYAPSGTLRNPINECDRDRILLMGVRSNIQPRHLQISQADAMKKVKECFNIFKRFSVETNGKIYGTTKEIGVLVVIMICLQIEKKCC